jgi:isopentenyl-diphosphate delta-isomerase type 1
MGQSAFVDVVDEKDNRLGQIPEAEAFKHKEKITRAIAVFVFNSKNELFLQKRSKAKFINPLCWTASVTGYVNSKESYLEAAVRETMEELGIRIESYDLEFMEKTLVKTEPRQFFQSYRLVWDGIFRLNPTEIDSGKFFSIQEIKNMIKDGEKFSPSFLELFEVLFSKDQSNK